MMTRRDFFILTVHFYPDAAKAGVHPIEPAGFPMESNPAYYRSTKFHFSKPPSRKDFMDMCLQHLPWTHVWKDSLFPLIQNETCQWPMVDCMHKAASSVITGNDGLKVGHLEVYRHSLYNAEGYDRNNIAIMYTNRDAVVRRVAKARRDEADSVLMREENRIQERLSHIEYPLDSDIQAAIRDVLVEHGFLKAKKVKAVTI